MCFAGAFFYFSGILLVCGCVLAQTLMKHIYFIKEKGGFINVLIGKDAWCCKNGYYKSDASLDDHSIEENAAGMIVGKSCVPRWK